MQRVICSGYYGKGNGGDEALLASLLQMLPPTVEPIILSGNPSQTQNHYQVEACDRMNGMEVLSALRRADALIWGGGSLIQDVTSAISPFYYGALMGLAQRMGLTTIAWAQGIGPLNRSISRWLAKKPFRAVVPSACVMWVLRGYYLSGIFPLPWPLIRFGPWNLDPWPGCGIYPRHELP